jgi:hypothetical protein
MTAQSVKRQILSHAAETVNRDSGTASANGGWSGDLLGGWFIIICFRRWFWDNIFDEPTNYPVGISKANNGERKMQRASKQN